MAKWSDFETHPVGTSDRIRELEAQVSGQDYDVHPVEMAARIKELEAQLAEATALIAELKGEKDE
jgi:uncharacterized coiled-coil protein SlyX